ncbi:phage portal protein family protein [Palleronia caenipelagi]|uniref:DUF935 domain-containing protein n=1 Tax=Palleronia caenipelagi TaxID=2489174 RepID=UPI00163D46BD
MGSVRQFGRAFAAQGIYPDRLAQILLAAEMGDPRAYFELAEDMEEKDLHYAAVLGVRKRAIRSLDLIVEAGDDTDAANDAADLVREELSGPAVREALLDMLDAVGKGMSICEIVWKGARVEAIEWRPLAWFDIDVETGTALSLAGDGAPLLPDKYVIHVAKTKSGLPVRGGLARLCAWAWMFKNWEVKDWAVFLEAYGHPLRLGKYDPNTTSPEDRRTLLRALKMMGTDMAAIIPHGMEAEVIAASVSGTVDAYERAARWWDEQISKGVLGQVATTDAIAGGHAVGKIHEQVRDDIRDADAEQLATTVMRDLARPLVHHNLGPGVALPRVRFAPPERVDPDHLLRLMEVAGPAGLQIATADIYRAFSIRRPDDEDEVLRFPAKTGTVDPPGAPGERQLASRQTGGDPVGELTEQLRASGALSVAVDADLSALLARIRDAGSFTEALAILAALEGESLTPELRALLARSIFNARLGGSMGL